jgi:enoyl-CoA hydratase/carnithine racemase
VLASDMVVAADNARFQAPFANMGIVPDGGLVWFLTHRLGRYRASEIVLSGRVVGAIEAQAANLVTRLVEPGQALATAVQMAATLGSGNRQAVELIKRLVQQAETSDLPSVFATELAYAHIAQNGEEVVRSRERRDGRISEKGSNGR